MFIRAFVKFYVFLFLICFAQADDVTVTVENVGQGNFVIVKRSYQKDNQTEHDYMIVDGGTTSYTSERLFKDINFEVEDTSKIQDFTSPSRPTLTENLKPLINDEKEVKSSILNNLRIKLIGNKFGKESPIFIKTIVITHPDLDHYGWIKDFFSHKDDKIYHIILGGLPQDYQHDFITWLANCWKKNTKIYFPAILHVPITLLKQDLTASEKEEFAPHLYTKQEKLGEKSLVYLQTESGEKEEEYKEALDFGQDVQISFWSLFEQYLTASEKEEFAPHLYTKQEKLGEKSLVYLQTESGKKEEEYKEALDFGQDVQISFLSINPTHHKKTHALEYYRQSLPSDSNTDSLVLKITHGQSSMILTGDATAATYARILDDYSDNPEFLQTDVLLASHHGSSAEGCNSLKWIMATQPKIVLISSGLTQGHPHKDSYDILKQSPRLRVYKNGHTIFVADDKKAGLLRKTKGAIFTTLCSGAMTVNLSHGGDIKLAVEYGEASREKDALTVVEGIKSSILEDEEQGKIQIKINKKGTHVAQTPQKEVGEAIYFSTRLNDESLIRNLFSKKQADDTTSSSAPGTKTPKRMSRTSSTVFPVDSMLPNTNVTQVKGKEPEEESDLESSSSSEEKKTPKKKTPKKGKKLEEELSELTLSASKTPVQQEPKKGGTKPPLGKSMTSVSSTRTETSSLQITKEEKVESAKPKKSGRSSSALTKSKSNVISKASSIKSSKGSGEEKSDSESLNTTEKKQEEREKRSQPDRKGKKKK